MDTLTKRINDALSSRKSCTVFRRDIEGITHIPKGLDEKTRMEIERYAEENGWTASMFDPGIRVTFRKKKV